MTTYERAKKRKSFFNKTIINRNDLVLVIRCNFCAKLEIGANLPNNFSRTQVLTANE